MDKARETAMKVLYAVHEEGAYGNVALAQALRRERFGETDRRFVTELVYGAGKAGDTPAVRSKRCRPMCGRFYGWGYTSSFFWTGSRPRRSATSPWS